jgi:hypothetical protein
MIDFKSTDRYGDILYCVKMISVFLENIHQINRRKHKKRYTLQIFPNLSYKRSILKFTSFQVASNF